MYVCVYIYIYISFGEQRGLLPLLGPSEAAESTRTDRVYVYVCVYIYIYIYIYMYIHTYTYIYIYIHTLKRMLCLLPLCSTLSSPLYGRLILTCSCLSLITYNNCYNQVCTFVVIANYVYHRLILILYIISYNS